MKNPVIIPLSNKSNVLVVFEKLEELILDGFWKPGEKIFSEAELCTRFNVGRSTIREALNMLKAKALVHTVAGLGTFAGNDPSQPGATYIPDPESAVDLLNIMELRTGLEPISAAYAARRASPEQLAVMEALQKELRQSDEADVFAESDLAFHMHIANAAANPMIEQAMMTVKSFLLRQQVITSQAKWRRNRAEKHHDQLLKAIREKNATQAETVMREHMDDTCAYVQSLIPESMISI